MDNGLNSALAGGVSCDVCGRRPHPRRLRLTLAKLAAVFPVELALHALVVHYHLSYAVTVAVLTVTTTVLVIWVVEPGAMRLLQAWLHAPTRRALRRVDAAPTLWRIRTTVDDEPGALERLARGLAALDANILGLHIHPLEAGTMDELVVSTPESVQGTDLTEALTDAGGRESHVWPTSALALVDGQTSALAMAARVAADPAELPLAVGELLRARIVTQSRSAPAGHRAGTPHDPTTLRIPSPWSGLFVFTRPGEPFTPAESARAHRLAEVAEATVVAAGTLRAQQHPGPGPAPASHSAPTEPVRKVFAAGNAPPAGRNTPGLRSDP